VLEFLDMHKRTTNMTISTKSFTLGTAALVTALVTLPAVAGHQEALEGCTNAISQDERLASYEQVSSRVDDIRARGRYTNFKLNVTATETNGDAVLWRAECKAKGSGKVASMELKRIDPPQVAGQ
jgi:hypothetical protein